MIGEETTVTRVTSTKRGRRSSRVEMEDEVGSGFHKYYNGGERCVRQCSAV